MHLLVQGCLRNDRDSQQLLYKHYYRFAMHVCVRYSKSVEEAKEIINDGFLKVFKKIAQYKQETSFEGWLRKIMVNTAIDHYRKESKHYDYYSTDKKTIEYGQTNIIDEMSHKELISLIQGLTPGYRAVFNLYVIDGYKHEEIAVLLHISVGTSKSNLSKAREILRTALEKMNTKTLVKYV